MMKATLTFGAGLTLLTGWLLVPDIASAQALKTPIEGSQANCSLLGEPEREWVDEDGIRHIRGRRFSCRHVGDIRGQHVSVSGLDIDLDGNVIFERGTVSFSGRILGDRAPATGHFTLECTRPEGEGMFTCIAEHIWHLEDGRLLKFTVIWVGPDFPRLYTGILLDPPGLGPVKRNRPRSR